MRVSLGEISRQVKDVDQAVEIIKQLETAALADNRIVSLYLVDGQEVADIEAYLAGKDGQEIKDIVLVTRTPQELVRESIVSFLDYVPALENGLMIVKEKLTVGDVVPKDSWIPLLDGLEWTNQLIQGLKALVEWDKATLETIATRWQETLSEMLSAWENDDKVLLADLLEYEILETLGELRSYFQECLAQGEEH